MFYRISVTAIWFHTPCWIRDSVIFNYDVTAYVTIRWWPPSEIFWTDINGVAAEDWRQPGRKQDVAGTALILSSQRLEQQGVPEDGFKLHEVATDVMSWRQLPSVLLHLYFKIIFPEAANKATGLSLRRCQYFQTWKILMPQLEMWRLTQWLLQSAICL